MKEKPEKVTEGEKKRKARYEQRMHRCKCLEQVKMLQCYLQSLAFLSLVLASVPSLLNDLKIVFELMRLAQVPLNPISNAGQDDRSCQPNISANNPPFIASTNLDDAPFHAHENHHDPQPFSGHDDISLLISEDLAFILANLDLDNPLLVSIAAGQIQIPAFNVQKQGFQGLKAPSVENINSEEEDRFAKDLKAPDIEDKDSMRKHPVIEGAGEPARTREHKRSYGGGGAAPEKLQQEFHRRSFDERRIRQ